MRILVKKVGELPVEKIVEHDIETMQSLVGGYLEVVRLPHDIDMWLNEEGMLIPLPINLVTVTNSEPVHVIFGDVFFASANDEGDTVSLNDFQIQWVYDNLFRSAKTAVKDDVEYSVGVLMVNN